MTTAPLPHLRHDLLGLAQIHLRIDFGHRTRLLPEHDARCLKSILLAEPRRRAVTKLVRVPAMAPLPLLEFRPVLLAEPLAPFTHRLQTPVSYTHLTLPTSDLV